jgi:flagellar basal body-associated protein FliL
VVVVLVVVVVVVVAAVVVVVVVVISHPSSQKQPCAEYKTRVTPQHVSIHVPLLFHIKPGSVSILRCFILLGMLDA